MRKVFFKEILIFNMRHSTNCDFYAEKGIFLLWKQRIYDKYKRNHSVQRKQETTTIRYYIIVSLVAQSTLQNIWCNSNTDDSVGD